MCLPAANNLQLCERCKRINFDAIFNSQKKITSIDGLPILELGDLSTALQTPLCPLCRLFIGVRIPQ